METLILAMDVNQVINVLYVIIGLGLVIFIHELGHFAVAKWCGVKVERFSIGFGPVLAKVTRGETEYALSAVPFGGYVKMLGQDDADPGQLTDARIARDPRSYTSKSVPQRMAIISAGVINNLVSAVLFFVIAFLMGVSYDPAVVGSVMPGGPAWKAGLRAGDQITRIGNTEDPQLWFHTVRMTVALSSGPVEVSGERPVLGAPGKTEPFTLTVEPEMKPEHGDMFPIIKMEPTVGLQFTTDKTDEPTEPGTAAAEAKPPFERGDIIRKVDGQDLPAFVDLQRALADKRDETVTITVERDKQPVDVQVPPMKFRTVGLQMDVGKIVAIQKGSPADGKLQEGDKITHVILPREGSEGEEALAVGDVLDPLKLPDLLWEHHGRPIKLRVQRQPEKGDVVEEVVSLTPDDRPGWLERPTLLVPDGPVSIPAIGVAYHVLHTVRKVEPKSAAAKAGIKPDDILEEVSFLDTKPDRAIKPVQFSPTARNWAAVFEIIQNPGPRKIQLKLKGKDKPVVLEAQDTREDWYRPIRGMSLMPLKRTYKAPSVGAAVAKGFQYTRDQVSEVYLMLRRLVFGQVSKRALGGPITIFQTAQMFAEKGIPDLILFLGILSISLAVLNFLPIPVLDGGHFVFLLWEGIRGKPASVRVIETATYIGLAMLLALMGWVMYLDIGRLIGN